MKYLLRFYPDTDVLKYPWVWHELPDSHLQPDQRKGTIRTGNMDGFRFDRLKRSIAEEGVLNPFIIEHYRKDLPNGTGFYDEPVLAIRTGNNRAEAMHQLGLRRASALFVVPRELAPALPDDPYEDIVVDGGLLKRIRGLWTAVVRDPEENHDGELGISDAWMDSNLLLEIVRSTLPNPQTLQKVRQRR
jgi:hypothetical protein